VKQRAMSRTALLGLIDNLESTIGKMRAPSTESHWSDYTATHKYASVSANAKEQFVRAYLERIRPTVAIDLGANTGHYSRLAAECGAYAVAVEGDPACVEFCAQHAAKESRGGVLPLCMDLTNPSPRLGWAHEERDSLAGRGPVDMVLALALVHHVAIANNVPLGRFLGYVSRLGRHAVVEFVPKDDEQVQRLLRSREDIFPGYTEAGFVSAAEPYFEVLEHQRLPESGRVLYLLRSHMHEPRVSLAAASTFSNTD
jgi:ribosomal protein L11 methylase PrmA